jgi:hypothetical protein
VLPGTSLSTRISEARGGGPLYVSRPSSHYLLPPPSTDSTGHPPTSSVRLTSGVQLTRTSNMSRSTPCKPKSRRSVKKLERQLGFDFSSGLASINRTTRDRPGPIGDLWESLKSLNEIRNISPQKLSNEARELFDLLGPSLWPRDTSQAWWLLKHPHIDYPRQLCYDDREDQEQYALGGLRYSQPLLITSTGFGATGRK